MALRPFTKPPTALDGYSFLVFGAYGAGKTRFTGEALGVLRADGPVEFLNIGRQDGYLSVAPFNLPGGHLDTLDDLRQYVKERQAKPLHAVAFDTLADVANLIVRNVTGGSRLPKMPKREEAGENEWSIIHMRMELLVADLRRCAKFVFFTAPDQKNENAVTGEWWIVPKLPGRQSSDCLGWFDFVAYLDADAGRDAGTKGLTRTLVLRSMPRGDKKLPGVLTRQRGLTSPITEDIEIPLGNGGFQAFTDTVIEHSK